MCLSTNEQQKTLPQNKTKSWNNYTNILVANSMNTTAKYIQGQLGAKIELEFEDLTKHEQLVVASLASSDRIVKTIRQIQNDCGWVKAPIGKARGNSRVRNALRRLVRANWVEHENEIGDGRYRLSCDALPKLLRLTGDAIEK
jgi:hypothetical protein